MLGMTSKEICIHAAICVLLMVVSTLPAFSRDLEKTDSPNSISRQIHYSFTLKNTTGDLIENARFWTYGPVKLTPTQQCVNIETAHPHEVIVDDLGNQILYFVIEKLPPYGSRILSITANLMMADSPNPEKATDLNPFLEPEPFIQCDDPQIIRTAQPLKAATPEKTAQNTFQWMVNHMTYAGFSGKDKGALYALEHKKGDCTEYMYLFAALCRANAIPARCVGGYICKQNEVLHPASYHNWAEIYENHTWQIADAHKRIFKQNAAWYVAMRIFGKTKTDVMEGHHRFRFEGKGLKVTMND